MSLKVTVFSYSITLKPLLYDYSTGCSTDFRLRDLTIIIAVIAYSDRIWTGPGGRMACMFHTATGMGMEPELGPVLFPFLLSVWPPYHNIGPFSVLSSVWELVNFLLEFYYLTLVSGLGWDLAELTGLLVKQWSWHPREIIIKVHREVVEVEVGRFCFPQRYRTKGSHCQ